MEMDTATAVQIIGEEEIQAIAERLVYARRKHPRNGGSREGSYQAWLSETLEVEQAFRDEGPERTDDELLDNIATCIRFRRREYGLCQP